MRFSGWPKIIHSMYFFFGCTKTVLLPMSPSILLLGLALRRDDKVEKRDLLHFSLSPNYSHMDTVQLFEYKYQKKGFSD